MNEKESDRSSVISIIIPAYQHARELPACLSSIFDQDYCDFEVIVVDDGSTDGTEEILRPFLSRISYVWQENQGANSARSRGYREARGRLVLFCDADIVMKPNCLKKMVQILESQPDAAYVYCSFMYGWKKFRLWPFDPVRLRRINYIHTTSLIRREYFPGFDEAIHKLQDWDLWLTMLERGQFGVWIPEYLFLAIPHRGGISTWIPGIFYRIPWIRLGLRMRAVERFQIAERIIKKKHHLN